MSEAERRSWVEFYDLCPFDDMHRFHRPAALVATSLGGGELQTRLDWLQPEPQEEITMDRFNEVDISVMRRFGFMRKGG